MQKGAVARLYDKCYSGKPFFYGIMPSGVLEVALTHAQKTGDLTALDLGSGEGRNAIHLAKEGWHVDAVDLSKRGLNKMMGAARKQMAEGTITPINADFLRARFGKKYGLVVCTNVLNILPEGETRWAMDRVRASVCPLGGLSVVSVFTRKNEFQGFPYLFEEGQLKEMYPARDWEVLHYQERFTAEEQHGLDGVVHRHHVAEIVAKRK